MRRQLATPTLRHRLAVPPGSAGACVARGIAFTDTTLTRYLPDADASAVGDALLVTAELLANAVRHAGGPLALDLLVEPRRERLRIEVTDSSHAPPVLRLPARPYQPHGHGLRIVDRVATAWGTTPTATGKTVWAELRLPAAEHLPGRDVSPATSPLRHWLP